MTSLKDDPFEEAKTRRETVQRKRAQGKKEEEERVKHLEQTRVERANRRDEMTERRERRRTHKPE